MLSTSMISPSYRAAKRTLYSFLDQQVEQSRARVLAGAEQSLLDGVIAKEMGEATRLPVQELRDELVTFVIAVSLFSELSSLWVETVANRFLRSLLYAGSRNNVVDDEVDPSILLQVSVGPVGSPRGIPPSPSGSRASKPNLRGDELRGNALP